MSQVIRLRRSIAFSCCVRVALLAVVVTVMPKPLVAAGAGEDAATEAKAFKQADKNGDGSLSFAEAAEFHRLLKAAQQSHPSKLKVAAPAAPAAGGDGIEMMTPEEEKESYNAREKARALNEKEGPVTRTIANYFTIHQSFFTDLEASFIADEDKREGISDPAKVTWTAIHGKHSTYQLDFAIQPNAATIERFEPMAVGGYKTFMGNVRAAIYPLFEAHVATEETESKNQLLYAVVAQLDVTHPTANFWKADHFFVLPSYETDRHANIRQRRLDALWSPDWRIPGWGQDISLRDAWSVFPAGWKFHFRPFAGIESVWVDEGFEKLVAASKLPTLEENYGFVHAGVTAQVRFEDRFAVTASYNYRAALYGKPGTHGFLEFSGSVLLDPAQHFSAGVTYTRGEDSPTFEDINKAQAWVGVEC